MSYDEALLVSYRRWFELYNASPFDANLGDFYLTDTPGESFGGGNYSAIVRVTDNGQPPLSDTAPLALSVNELDVPPAVDPLPNKTIHAGIPYQVTATGSDGDLPPQQLTFILDDFGTVGATIDSVTGVFSWTPALPNTTNTFEIKVVDNGAPPYQSAPVTFVLTVAAELKITYISREFTGLLLRWNTMPGRRYQLQSKDELESPWTPLGEPQTAGGDFLKTIDPSPSATQRFYSVRLLSD